MRVNSFDTNGVNQKPVRYYWQDATLPFDSNSTNPALDKAKTDKDSTTWPVRSGEANKGKGIWIYARDDDGLVRGGQFVVYCDSAPPPPDTVSPHYDIFVNAATVTLIWQGVDVHDGDQTQYRIVMDGNTTPTTVVSDFKAGTQYTALGGGQFSATVTPPGTAGTKFWRIQARDARGSVSAGPVSRFIYNP